MKQRASGRIAAAVILLCALIIGGCVARQEEEPAVVVQVEEEKYEEIIIPVDYPFSAEMEGYRLSLVSDTESPDVYEVRLCDETGKIVQQFSCGQLKEPLVFCDALTSWRDLEIFSGAEEEEEQTGLLFVWDQENNCFLEEGIEIPWYKSEKTDEEFAWRGRGFLVSRDTETREERRICQIDLNRKETVELGRWTFDQAENRLTIWNSLEDTAIFEGIVETDSDGRLNNEMYFWTLFQEQLSFITISEPEQSEIFTWVSRQESEDDEEQSGFEYVQEHVFGNKGGMESYASRQDLLADFGFVDCAPFYELHDRFGNLLLELYLDEQSGIGCGLRHVIYFVDDSTKTEELYGFAFDSVEEAEWEEPKIYIQESVYGGNGADSVEDFKEELECTDDGKPEHYRSTGIIDWLGDEEIPIAPANILSIDYIYREDGTLYRRDYVHNPYIFATTSCSLDSYYDEAERLIYENGYITHGDYENYYIYTDEGRKPVYGLMLDNNLNYYIPVLVRYE